MKEIRTHPAPGEPMFGTLVGYVIEERTGRRWTVKREGRRHIVTLQWGARHSFAFATRDLSLGSLETVVRRMQRAAPTT